jgi:hypothetical protein
VEHGGHEHRDREHRDEHQMRVQPERQEFCWSLNDKPCSVSQQLMINESMHEETYSSIFNLISVRQNKTQNTRKNKKTCSQNAELFP